MLPYEIDEEKERKSSCFNIKLNIKLRKTDHSRAFLPGYRNQVYHLLLEVSPEKY